MDECLVVIGALSTATAEKLASGIRSRSKNELFCTVIEPEIESTLKLTLWSPTNAYVTFPNMPKNNEMEWCNNENRFAYCSTGIKILVIFLFSHKTNQSEIVELRLIDSQCFGSL